MEFTPDLVVRHGALGTSRTEAPIRVVEIRTLTARRAFQAADSPLGASLREAK